MTQPPTVIQTVARVRQARAPAPAIQGGGRPIDRPVS